MNIVFDNIERTVVGERSVYPREQYLLIQWFKDGREVHRLELSENAFLKRDCHCNACLFWRGALVYMSDRKTIVKGCDSFTYPQCPECKGIGFSNRYCSCGETPHRISCPMGIDLYFR